MSLKNVFKVILLTTISLLFLFLIFGFILFLISSENYKTLIKIIRGFCKGHILTDYTDLPVIKDYIYYILTLLEIFITAIFSYLLFNISKKSNDLSKNISESTEKSNEIVVLMSKNAVLEQQKKIKSSIFHDVLYFLNRIRSMYITGQYDTSKVDYHNILHNRLWLNQLYILDGIDSTKAEKLYEIYDDIEHFNSLDNEYRAEFVESKFCSFFSHNHLLEIQELKINGEISKLLIIPKFIINIDEKLDNEWKEVVSYVKNLHSV